MYQIKYCYYKRGKDKFQPTGQPIFETVKGNTIKELNTAFLMAQYNHNCFEFTQMSVCYIEEIK